MPFHNFGWKRNRKPTGPCCPFAGGAASQRCRTRCRSAILGLAITRKASHPGKTLYILDEPAPGLHPADAEQLLAQLEGLVESGNIMVVIVVRHDMRVASDWIIDIGPGAGAEGGRVVAAGPPAEAANAPDSRTAPYLARLLSTKTRNATVQSSS